jgi:trehalose 6-phosphate phosphatase
MTDITRPDHAMLSPSGVCLFLDVDGTLVDFAPTPDAVRVDTSLLRLLDALFNRLDGAVALISGRPLASIDALFAPLVLPAAGIHGFERRSASGVLYRPTLPSQALDDPRARLQSFARAQPGTLLEDKGIALALHFRGAAGVRAEAHLMVSSIAARLDPAFEILEGDQVIEIKPASMNKAVALEGFMKESPFAGRQPIYIGDDVTDVDGFSAARRNGGVDIAVGSRVTARWGLPDTTAVRSWLAGLVQ